MLLTAAAGVAAGCSSRAAETPTASSAKPAVDLTFEPAETDIDLGGVSVRTWAYNGQVPGNEIRIRKGETLRAAVTNKLPPTPACTGTAGDRQRYGRRSAADAVADPGGRRFTYEFMVPDAGTYWYHSHVGTQLDRGLYGPLIIEDPAEKADYDEELVVVLDDWIDGTGTNPDQVLENLRKTGMKPMAPGGPGVSPTTPLGTDTGDVTYPHFVINGRVPADPEVRDYRSGQRIRLRVINAGSDTAFRIAVPDTDLNVIATDGYPVMPHRCEVGHPRHGRACRRRIHRQRIRSGGRRARGQAGTCPAERPRRRCAERVKVDDFVAAVRKEVVLDTATLSPIPEVTLPARTPDQVIEAKLSGPVPGYTWPFNGRSMTR